jgi:hypothetical protein
MANECRGSLGTWGLFTLVYDKDISKEEERGVLDIEESTSDNFVGHHRESSSTTRFTGTCKRAIHGPNRVMTFELTLDGAVHLFRGVVLGANVNGGFVVTSVSRELKTFAVGDTGTWGGNQGALLTSEAGDGEEEATNPSEQ